VTPIDRLKKPLTPRARSVRGSLAGPLMLFIAAVVDAEAGLLGTFVRADFGAIELAVADDALAGLNHAMACGTSAFDGRCG
jgi:hypothetical protein